MPDLDLNLVIKDVDKKLKVTKLDDPESLCNVTLKISSRCLPLDRILGGGWPVRRTVEIYGDNSTGKTMLATGAIAETQSIGGLAIYGDAEIALDPTRMEVLGVDNSKLIYFNPNTINDVFQGLDEFITHKTKHYGKTTPMTYVVDSVSALATMDEMETSDKDGWESRQYPSAARYISQAFRQIPAQLAENNVLLLLINQTREKLGQMYGDGVATYGGKAVSFYSSIRVELETKEKIRDEKKRIIGGMVKATTVKNRLYPPYRNCILPVYYAYGIDEAEATLEYMLSVDIIGHEKGSPWYTLKLADDEIKFQRKTWSELFQSKFNAISELLKV